jgi:hypothetical protein
MAHPKRNSPPLSSPPRSFLAFNNSSPQPPNQVGTESSRLLIDLPQNKSLAGGRLALASVACLLADYDGDWRLRLLDYSRPPPTAFPLMAGQEGYEIDGWMLNDATEQQRREKEGLMGGVLIQLALCFEVRAERGCSRRRMTSIAVAGQKNEDGILYQIQHTLGQQQPLAAGRANQILV